MLKKVICYDILKKGNGTKEKKMLEKLKGSKILKIIGNITYILMIVIVILMLAVVVIQRTTNNNITIGGIRMFSVATGSMVPVYNVGDILISKEIKPENIKVGDDLVYIGKDGAFKNKVVTHRVISIEEQEDKNYKIVTKGVANNAADPEIDQTQIYGKIIYKVHSLSFLGKMVRNVYTIYVIIFICIGIFVYRNIINIINTVLQRGFYDVK